MAPQRSTAQRAVHRYTSGVPYRLAVGRGNGSPDVVVGDRLARQLRDTLLLGLMYGAGLRVSEVVRLKWSDIDEQRNQIFIRQAKGNADRHVQLPQPFQTLIKRWKTTPSKADFIFPSETARCGRHLSPRTVQRAMQAACRLAGIQKKATPHSLRHAFATHSFEAGCDIRRIQKVLGHVRLETTTLYITVAKDRTDFASPWDRLESDRQNDAKTIEALQATSSGESDFRIHCRRDPDAPAETPIAQASHQFTLEAIDGGKRHFLTGTTAKQTRPGFIQVELPPLEQWQPVIEKLSPRIAARLHSVEFYELLRNRIGKKLLKQIARSSPR